MARIHRACALLFLSIAAAPAFASDSKGVSSETKLSSFTSVYVAPVDADLPATRSGPPYLGEDRPVSDQDAARKAGDLRDQLVQQFGKSFGRASAPGAGVLTVEATLTRLQSSRPTIEDMRETPGLSMESRYAGGAAVTIAFSVNGARLGEFSDSHMETLDNHRIQAGIWTDADRAFSILARRAVEHVKEN